MVGRLSHSDTRKLAYLHGIGHERNGARPDPRVQTQDSSASVHRFRARAEWRVPRFAPMPSEATNDEGAVRRPRSIRVGTRNAGIGSASVLLAELVHAAAGVDDLLLAGVER